MAGWVLGIDSLTRIFPSGINMKFPTASSFFLSAFGLYYIFRTVKDNYEASRVILPGIAIAIFLFQGIILMSYLTDTFTGLDMLFVVETSHAYGAGSGLPAINTMISFILFGVVCVAALFPGPRLSGKIKFFGYFILIFGTSALGGYAFGLPWLYSQFIDSMIPMAVNTALLFVLLGLGLVVISKIEK